MTNPSTPLPRRTPADDATLALLLEVAGTPKPGNVDRERDLTDLRFESFLGGAVGARDGLERAARGASIGVAFERAVRGMADRAGTNTQFGCLLLLVPLIKSTADGDLTPEGVDRITRATTVDDAVDFYTAFEHVDVAVGDPPAEAAALDVRRGGDAEPALRERGCTLRDVMALDADANIKAADPDRIPDRNAREWVEGFPRSFRIADRIVADEGPVVDRAARAFLLQLAADPDTLVATAHGPATARRASRRVVDLLGGGDGSADGGGGGGGSADGGGGGDGRDECDAMDPATIPDPLADHVDLAAAEELAEAFVEDGINPGTTADLTCAGLYIALRRGVEVGG